MYECDKNLMDALEVFDLVFDRLASRKRTSNAEREVWSADNGYCNRTPDGRYEIEMKKENSRFDFCDLLDDVDQVIYNDPATIVTFKDGTKVCVKASKNDKFSKETGLVYAIVKRLYANDIDSNGYLTSSGLGTKISKVVENAVDQKKIEAERRAKMRAKAKAKEAKAKEQLANEAGEKAANEGR